MIKEKQSMNIFDELNSELKENLSSLSITEPTPVQKVVIPKILENENIIFESETGTGKTLAYLLPLIEKIKNENEKSPLILIASPTLELASQIRDVTKKITNTKTALLIGGSPLKRQIDLLKEKPLIIIGNPSRLAELCKLKKLKLDKLKCAVFDEVDRLVKKEIVSETKELISFFPKNLQLISCTATITQSVKSFFPSCTLVYLPKENILQSRIEHWAFYAEEKNKLDILQKLIKALINTEGSKEKKILVFTQRLEKVQSLESRLLSKKIKCESLHTKMNGQERKSTLDRFRSSKNKILITSDVTSRGLDIPNITHIVQMDLPEDENFFIHRAGRCARYNKRGVNILIGDEYELKKYSALEKKLKLIVYPKIVQGGVIRKPVP